MPPGRYDPTLRLLHWVVGLLVVAMLALGLTMTAIGAGPLQNALFQTHKAIGLLLIPLILLRLVWRFVRPRPALAGIMPAWQAGTALTTHLLLYLLVVVMLASGYTLTVAGGYPLPLVDSLGVPHLVPASKPLGDQAGAVHDLAKTALIVLVSVHILAALHHLLVRRDGVFFRMWPIGGTAARVPPARTGR